MTDGKMQEFPALLVNVMNSYKMFHNSIEMTQLSAIVKTMKVFERLYHKSEWNYL